VQFTRQPPETAEPDRFFNVDITVAYRRVLTQPLFRFLVTDVPAALHSRIGVLADWDYVWVTGTNLVGPYGAANPESFKVNYFRAADIDMVAKDIDPAPLGLLPSQEQHFRVIEVSSPDLAVYQGKEVAVNYSFQVKVPRLSHFLYLPLTQTCEGVRYEFELDNVGVASLSVFPYFLSADRPLFAQRDIGSRRVITVATNRWVLSGGGIALGWRLDEEDLPAYRDAVYGGSPTKISQNSKDGFDLGRRREGANEGSVKMVDSHRSEPD
jgi:hypothetical protein